MPQSYFEVRRVWQPGDFVDLDLPMPARLMEANPLVEEDLNQVAVQRGPVVYCLESPDLPPGVRHFRRDHSGGPQADGALRPAIA